MHAVSDAQAERRRALDRAKAARYRARHPDRIKEYKQRTEQRIRQVAKEYRANNLLAHREKGKRIYAERRAAILEFFGPHCVRCGFSDRRALQIDHVHGGGARERKGKEMSYVIMEAITSDPREACRRYQVLCANCNVIKRIENEEHAPPRVYGVTPRLTTSTAVTED